MNEWVSGVRVGESIDADTTRRGTCVDKIGDGKIRVPYTVDGGKNPAILWAIFSVRGELATRVADEEGSCYGRGR